VKKDGESALWHWWVSLSDRDVIPGSRRNVEWIGTTRVMSYGTVHLSLR
jgi:hypothetical protein